MITTWPSGARDFIKEVLNNDTQRRNSEGLRKSGG